MKILVVSDCHGRSQNFKDAIAIEKPDRIYHLGDSQGVEDSLWMATDVPVEWVAGNNDWGSNMPSEVVLELGNHVLLLTHGHYYHVLSGVSMLAKAAKDKGCDVALYGHTHVPGIDNYAGIICANPGSITQPRQASREHTYMIITVDEAGELRFDLHSLEEYDRKWKLK